MLPRACRQWLSCVRLQLTELEEQASLLENPLSNGALLLDLCCLWLRVSSSAMPGNCNNKKDVFSDDAMWKAPQTVPEARIAIASALQALGLAVPSQVDVGYPVLQQGTSVVEAVVQGNMQVIWGIICQVMMSLTRADNELHSGKHRQSLVYLSQ